MRKFKIGDIVINKATKLNNLSSGDVFYYFLIAEINRECWYYLINFYNSRTQHYQVNINSAEQNLLLYTDSMVEE